MQDRHRSALVFVASQLVVLAAVIHLVRGVGELGRYAGVGILVPPDVRWPLFVLSGVAILVGVWYARQSTERRRWYLAGVVAMLGYVGAYFLWHLGGHRRFFVVGPATTHEITVGFVLAHYLAGPVETFTLTVELVAAVVLAILYVDARD